MGNMWPLYDTQNVMTRYEIMYPSWFSVQAFLGLMIAKSSRSVESVQLYSTHYMYRPSYQVLAQSTLSMDKVPGLVIDVIIHAVSFAICEIRCVRELFVEDPGSSWIACIVTSLPGATNSTFFLGHLERAL